jgi:hypothetical protein
LAHHTASHSASTTGDTASTRCQAGQASTLRGGVRLGVGA